MKFHMETRTPRGGSIFAYTLIDYDSVRCTQIPKNNYKPLSESMVYTPARAAKAQIFSHRKSSASETEKSRRRKRRRTRRRKSTCRATCWNPTIESRQGMGIESALGHQTEQVSCSGGMSGLGNNRRRRITSQL